MGDRVSCMCAAIARGFVSSLVAIAFLRWLLALSSAALTVAVAMPSLASAASSVPLPADTHVVTPSQDIPPELAVFSGKWIGVWADALEHVLVVEEIKAPDVTAIYAYGESKAWGISK